MAYKIYIVDDDENILRFMKFALKDYKVRTFIEPRSLLETIHKDPPDLIISDMVMPEINGLEVLKRVKKEFPRIPVLIITAYSSIENAVESIKSGAFDYIVKPLNVDDLRLRVKKALEMGELKAKFDEMQKEYKKLYSIDTIIGKSKSVKEIKEFIFKVNELPDATILIRGESGTGKNLIARVIHYTSSSAESRYVEINCAAIPSNLLESELFGHEKGAFTDAKATKKGLFEIADGGTIVLDEIGALDIALQAKLLSVVETKMFRRVGGTEDISVNLRIIAATNANLDELVAKNQFRQDLYFRINVISLVIPPLRERREDILPLAYHFIDEFNNKLRRNVKGLTSAAEKKLLEYKWPGNVRELLNVIERAMIFADKDKKYLSGDDIIIKPIFEDIYREHFPIPRGIPLSEAEKEYIRLTLEWTNYDYSKAAEILGITTKTLWEKRRKYGLK